MLLALFSCAGWYSGGISIGQPANLIYGIKYGMDSSDIFYPPTTSNVFKKNYNDTVHLSDVFDVSPSIAFCDNYTHLLQTFFDYIEIEQGFKAAGLMFQPGSEQETANELASLLGVKQEDADLMDNSTAFALVRQWKRLRKHYIDDVNSLELTNQTDAALSNIDYEEISDYANVFENVGTHYISEYITGDFVYQIFAYEELEYQGIRKRFPNSNYSDPVTVFTFSAYTEPKGEYQGYSKYYGPVKIASDHSKFYNEIVPELEDPTNVVSQSIFRLTAKQELYDKLNGYGTEIIAGVKVVSLNDFTTENIYSRWSQLMKNSLYEKFGSMSKPGFHLVTTVIDYASVYSEFTPLYPTMTATYLLGMKYLYLNLKSVQMLEPDKVKTILLIADVIEIDSDVDLPGNANVIIICNSFVSKSHEDYVPTLTVHVDPTNKDQFQLITFIFHGSLKLQQALSNSYQTIMDGQVLYLDDSSIQGILTVSVGHIYNRLLANKTTAPFLYDVQDEIFGNDWVITSFQDGLSYFLTSIENILNYNIGEGGPSAAYDFAEWIVNSLNETMDEGIANGTDAPLTTLTNVYSRALILVKTRNPERDSIPVFVPFLAYQMYEDTINKLVDLAKEYGSAADNVEQRIADQRNHEEVTDNQEELNKQIQNVTKFLVGQNSAMQAKESDLSTYYKNLIEQKQASLDQARQQQDDLNRQIINQQYVMEVAQTNLEIAIEDQVTADIFNAVVAVTKTCAQLFMAVPPLNIPKDMSDLLKTAKKVKNALDAILAFKKVLQGALNGPPDINEAIDYMNRMPFTEVASAFPTELDWTRLLYDVEGQMAGLPVPQAGRFLTETKMYVAIGKQYTATSQRICQLEHDISLDLMNKYIHDEQAKRLNDLGDLVNQGSLTTAQAMNIDLFQLGTILQASQDRVLLQLMDVMQEQDGALQYYTLQKPIPITRYDILSIKDTIAQRAFASLNAFKSFNPPPHELEELKTIEIESVPFLDLSGPGFIFSLNLNEEEFYSYVRVRITEVQAYIDNLVTDTGKLYVKMMGGGDMYFDRGLQRQTLNFSTYPHIYPFVYNISSLNIIEGNRITGDDLTTYNLLTPFTQWNIMIPVNSPENKGLLNSSTDMTVTLKFRISVIRVDPKSSYDDTGKPVDESTVVQHMSSEPQTYGWDVVGCMDAEKITELFAELYKDEENSGLVYEIDTVHVSQNLTSIYQGTEFTARIGPPLISFINRQPSIANLTMVYEEGFLNKTMVVWDVSTGNVSFNQTQIVEYKDGVLTSLLLISDSGGIITNETTVTTPTDTPNIVGKMQLSKLQGRVDNYHEVIINLGKGTFDTQLTMDPNIDDDLEVAVRNYFRDDLADYNYILGTVIYNVDDTPPALQPTMFEISTDVPYPESKGILYMFIKTNASDSKEGAKNELKLSVSPIPINRTATLIVSNKVLMSHFVLPAAKVNISSSMYAKSSDPSDDPYVITSTKVETINGVSVDFHNFHLKVADAGGNLNLDWTNNWEQKYTYTQYDCPTFGGGACVKNTYNDYMPINVNAEGTSDLEVDINPDNDVISFTPFDAKVTFKFSPPKKSSWQKYLDGTSGITSNMDQAANEMGQALQDQFGTFTLDVSSVSVFAVANLLFPNGKVMDLKSVYLAQDLVMFGDVSQDYKP